MPGQRSSPLISIVWASGGIGVPAGPIAAILPPAITRVPPLISGPAIGCRLPPTKREEALGLSGDLDRPVACRFGRGRHGRVLARANAQAAAWLVSLEEDLAVDHRQLAAREGVERMAVEQDDVGVLADLDRAQPPVQAELPGGVDRDHRQGLSFGNRRRTSPSWPLRGSSGASARRRRS